MCIATGLMRNTAGLSTVAPGLVRVTFDAAPTAYPPGGSACIQEYEEAGVSFRPMLSSGRFVRVWPTFSLSSDPFDGTVFVRTGREDESLSFGFSDGSAFSLESVDLAEYRMRFGPATVSFVGYRRDGTTVSTTFTTDGIATGAMGDFETFHFDPRFSDLVQVDVPGRYWSLDNVVLATAVPEPTSRTLLMGGGFALWFLVRTRRGKRQQGKGFQP